MSNPQTTINLLSAQTPQRPDDRSILVIGQKIGGTATAGALVEDIISKEQAATSFGQGSMVYKALAAILDKCSISLVQPKIAAISLADAGGATAATATLTFTGTATTAGKIVVYIDSIQRKYEVDVAIGDIASDIATSFASKINADADRAVQASDVGGVITITARNAGSQGNTIGTQFDLGLSKGVTLVTTAMSGGATDPALTGLFDPIANKRFTSIVYPAEYGIATLTTETEARFNVDNKVLDGVGIVAVTDTYTNLNTQVDALNQKTLVYRANKLINDADYRGGAVFESPLVLAARAAAIRELRLTVDANTSSLSPNGQAQGGSFFGAIPYFNTPEAGLPVIKSGNDFTDAESNELKNSGAWLLSNNSNNTTLIYDEAVTTYKTNSLGQVDTTYKYLNYVDTLTIARDYMFKNIKADFSQSILTSGKLVAGRPMVNAKSFEGTLVGYYATLSGFNGDNNYVLLVNSEAAKNQFRDAIRNSIVVNLAEGKITTDILTSINTQLRTILINITPTFE